MRKLLIFPLLAALLLVGGCRSAQGNGALFGALAGAGIGAAVDGGKARWGGALAGAAIGAGVGYVIGDHIEDRKRSAAREAARSRRPVAYRIEDEETHETYRVRATPEPPTTYREPRGGTRVTTTVSKWNPKTGRWEVVSESSQVVD